MTKPLFEHQSCTRCGGSGRFSWCQMHGDRCFKCGGSGFQLTKRGAVAQEWFRARKMRPAGEIQIGDRIVIDGVPGFSKSEVVIVDSLSTQLNSGRSRLPDGTWQNHNHLVIDGVGAKSGKRSGLHTFPEAKVKMHIWGEALVALQQEALAFQSTLTKSGKVSAR